MEDLPWKSGAKRQADFADARLFLADLHIEAEIFSKPGRSEEWLGIVENLYHTLLSLENEWVSLSNPPGIPAWFSAGSMGQSLGTHMKSFMALPGHELERMGTERKFAFHAALVGALALACTEISLAMQGCAGK